MQLTRLRRPKAKKIVTSLAAATCALLGGNPAAAAEGDGEKRWKFDTAVLYYDEGDRVTDASANLLAQRIFDRGRRLAIKFGVDSLTGASANGAVPATTPQTFTSPSGNGTYNADPGDTPLDDTFLDTRFSLGVNWGQPLGKRSTVDFGVSLSNEYDYFHSGVNAKLARDFNERNTTLNLGVAFAHDTIDPVGGAPVPLAAMLPQGDLSNKESDDSKTVSDLVIGVTHVLGKRMIGQLNYSLSYSDGYLADPYKLLSVVDPVTGNPAPGPGNLNLYLYEGRPDSRLKHSLFVQVKRQVRRDIVDASYRFMTDDWGIDSHTLELRYRFRFERFYLQPHLRYYTQSEADFYRTVLFAGDPVPKEASADYRLGEFDGYTLGLKYGHPLGDGEEWGLRVEYYEQSGRAPPEASVGALQGFDLDTDLDAIIVQAGYRF
jgi:hypothetical protein